MLEIKIFNEKIFCLPSDSTHLADYSFQATPPFSHPTWNGSLENVLAYFLGCRDFLILCLRHFLRDEESSTVKVILELTSLWWWTICASNEMQVVLLHHLFCFSKFYFTLSTKTGHRCASGRKAYRKAFKHKTVKNLWKCFK